MKHISSTLNTSCPANRFNPRQTLKKTLRLLFCIICVLGIAGNHYVTAQWSANPEINNAISIAKYAQYAPEIISDNDGGAIIAWHDSREGGGDNYDIYVQRINACGEVQWKIDGLPVCTAINSQWIPNIVTDGEGGAIITWSDFRSGNYDIYTQRVDANGVIRWALDGIPVCTVTTDQYHIKTVSDGSGGVIITWYNVGDDIFAQRINASGVAQWKTNGVAICTAPDSQINPKIVSDGEGGAIITWSDLRNFNVNIYAQRINAEGTVQWKADGVAITTAANALSSPVIIAAESGAIIAWQDRRNGNYDIYAQRINPLGVAQWTPNGVPLSIANNDQWAPVIAKDESGGAIISWNDDRVVGNNDIYAQRIDGSGAVQWTANGVAIRTATNSQFAPAIISDATGGAIITRSENRNGSKYDIYAQKINSAGLPQWTSGGVAISTAENNQFTPLLTSDGVNGAIIAWLDVRSGDFDVYAQNVRANGTIGSAASLITNQPLSSQTTVRDSVPADLVVTATGEITYQWFSNTSASRVGATSLNASGTGSSFTPSTSTLGTLYYFCRLIGNCDTVYSDFAEVIVKEPIPVPIPVSDLQIIVTPNPTGSAFNIVVKSPGAEAFEIRMVDMLGRTLEYGQGFPDEIIRLGDYLAAGMYLIEVRQAGRKAVKKAVKQ